MGRLERHDRRHDEALLQQRRGAHERRPRLAMAATHEDRNAQLSPGVAIKAPCRAATTGAITFSGEQTIDGVACVTGDRALVKDQASAISNGIYTVSTGAWTRAPDFDGNRDVVTGTFVFITNGAANAGAFYE